MNFLRFLLYTGFLAFMAMEYRRSDTAESQFLVGIILLTLFAGWLYTFFVMWEEEGRGDQG